MAAAVSADATITLAPSNGPPVEVKRALMFKHSATIKQMVEDLEEQGDGDKSAVPLTDAAVNQAECLQLVVKWLLLHEADAPFDRSQLENYEYLEAPNTDVDKGFVAKINNKQLYDLMMAANFLGMDQLLDCLQKAVAAMIEGLTAEQIRQKFNIANDFTAEQLQAQIDDPWGWNDGPDAPQVDV